MWTGAKIKDGYGRIMINKKSVLVHRYSAEAYFGPFDPDLCVLHSCDVPNCVNPLHLRLGDRKDNMADAIARNRIPNQQKVSCLRGHALDEDNVYVTPKGHRQCKQCRNIRTIAYRERKKASHGIHAR